MPQGLLRVLRITPATRATRQSKRWEPRRDSTAVIPTRARPPEADARLVAVPATSARYSRIHFVAFHSSADSTPGEHYDEGSQCSPSPPMHLGSALPERGDADFTTSTDRPLERYLPDWPRVWAACVKRTAPPGGYRPDGLRGTGWEEIDAEGIAAACQAVRPFDPSRGPSLSYFVYHRVLSGAAWHATGTSGPTPSVAWPCPPCASQHDAQK